MRFFLRNRGKWRQDQRYCFSYNKQTSDPHTNFLIAFTSEALTTNIQAPEKLKPQFTSRGFSVGNWSLFGVWSLEFGAFGLQADRMSCVKPPRWAVNGLPARRPFAGVTIEWCCIQSQSGNDCERVTLARVDGDPFAKAALAVAAKLG